MRRWPVYLLCLAGFVAPAMAVSSKDATGALFAAGDGRGEVRLWWFPPLAKWPAGGWRLEQDGGRVLVERIAAGESEALRRLPPDDADAITKFAANVGRITAPADRRLAFGMIGARAMGDWDYARALGLAWSLTGVSGRHVYRIVGLDAAGRPDGITLTSVAADGGVAAPAPAAPRALTAQAARNGVALYWQPPPERRELPAIAYRLERDGGGAEGVAVTPRPVVRGLKWPSDEPGFVDTQAPLEAELTYRLYSVDVLGRDSLPVAVKLYAADLRALEPPAALQAKSEGTRVALAWQATGNPHTAGYVVERGLLYGGPYEALTPDGLSAKTDRYEDRDLRIGTTYYYRVRSANARGEVGPPSRVAVVQPAGATPRPAEALKADVGNTRVRLTWQGPGVPVAGYFVERSADGDTWQRLNARPTPEPLYDDQTGFGRKGALRYRVVTVAWDSSESRPSDTVEVSLPDTDVPSPPQIVAVSGDGGRVRIDFVPAEPAADARGFLLVRGGSALDPGLVIGDPLSADARRIEDEFVLPGQDYWYRMVAVDAKGNRSAPGRAVAVHVGAPQLPTPPRPDVRFVAEPFARVEIGFGAPPAGLAVMVEARAGEAPWQVVEGPVAVAGVAVDSNPPKQGRKFYRIVYRAANGSQGMPSEAAEVNR